MANPNDNAPAEKSNKTLWLIIIVLLLIVVSGAAAAGTYFFMSGASQQDGPEDAEQAEAKPPPKPVFVKIDPFTVNMKGDRGRVLYLRLALKVGDDQQATRLTEHMPQVRNRIVLTLSDTEARQLVTAEGKQALAVRLRNTVAAPFIADAEPIGVSDVLFTDFIVQ